MGRKKLKEISDNIQYGLNAPATQFDGVNKYLRITDIDDSTRQFRQSNITSPNIDLDASTHYILDEGDILFARTGASVGKSYLYKKSDGLVYFAGFLIRARIKSEYNAVFVYQNTLTCSYYNYINILSQRSGQPGVNAQEYGDFSISLPTLPEQTKIGDFFQSLDATVALREQELETLKTSKQGFLQKMFPRAQDKASPNCALLALRKIGKKRNWEMWLKLQVEEHQAHK